MQPRHVSSERLPEGPAGIRYALACRGLEKAHFRQFLQCWALLQMEPLYKVAQDIAPALSRPLSEVIRSQQVHSVSMPCIQISILEAKCQQKGLVSLLMTVVQLLFFSDTR